MITEIAGMCVCRLPVRDRQTVMGPMYLCNEGV